MVYLHRCLYLLRLVQRRNHGNGEWKETRSRAESIACRPRRARYIYQCTFRFITSVKKRSVILIKYMLVKRSKTSHCYPHMPIGKVWTVDISVTVCLFVRLYGYGFIRRG